MGSTNTGRFSDYSDNSNSRRKSSGDGGGGSSGDDKCQKAIHAKLEEVERCEYYRAHSVVPVEGTAIEITLNGRLCATTIGSEVVGYLPTKYNYLAICIQDGFSYVGEITSSSTNPIVRVTVDIAPE